MSAAMQKATVMACCTSGYISTIKTGTPIGNGGATFSTSTSWNFLTATATVPANAVSFTIICYDSSGSGTNFAYFDKIFCERVATIAPWSSVINEQRLPRERFEHVSLPTKRQTR